MNINKVLYLNKKISIKTINKGNIQTLETISKYPGIRQKYMKNREGNKSRSMKCLGNCCERGTRNERLLLEPGDPQTPEVFVPPPHLSVCPTTLCWTWSFKENMESRFR